MSLDIASPAPNAAAKQTDALRAATDTLKSARLSARAAAKTDAHTKIEALRKQIQLLSRLLSGDPKALAKEIARISKELRAALKEFVDAHKGDVEDAGSPEAQTAAEPGSLQARQRAAGAEETPEAKEMKSIVGDVRSLLTKLRDLLQQAKNKATAAPPPKPGEKDPFKLASEDLTLLTDDLNRAFSDASIEAKVFDPPAPPADTTGSIVSLRV